jgi:glycosyltransferase involved in cell wall biosynthesis
MPEAKPPGRPDGVSGAKRILVIANHDSAYGAPMAALRLASGLRERTHLVSAHFLYSESRIDSPYLSYDILFPGPSPDLLEYLRIFARTIALVRRAKPDVVITFMPLAGIFGQLAARIAGVQKRIVSHRAPVNTYGRIMRWLDTLLARFGVYTDVVAVSESVRASCSHYPKRLRQRTVVVHNGLLDWRPSYATRSEARAAFGFSESDFVLAAVGRIEAQKNFSFLLPVVARLDGVTLVIAGAGSLRTELEEMVARLGIQSRVCLLGVLPRERIPDLLRAADLFVQPSIYEGQSNALLEALYAGLPVLTSDVPEQVETVTHSDGRVAGAVLPLDDGEAWVHAIERFQGDAEALAEVRPVTRLRAEVFSFDRMISGFEQVLAGS